jgi:hypothetical protein
MKFNLLTEPLIQSDVGWHSLPGLLAAMARGEVSSFPALRPHQRPAWHMFLVQLATLALDAAGERDLPVGGTDWAAALRALIPGHDDDAAWHLVVEDSARPAFLQPPDPGGLNWSNVPTPDALDMLITARNHDLKAQIAQVSFFCLPIRIPNSLTLRYGVLRGMTPVAAATAAIDGLSKGTAQASAASRAWMMASETGIVVMQSPPSRMVRRMVSSR